MRPVLIRATNKRPPTAKAPASTPPTMAPTGASVRIFVSMGSEQDEGAMSQVQAKKKGTHQANVHHHSSLQNIALNIAPHALINALL